MEEPEKSEELVQPHYCYMLVNESRRNTYVGYTVSPCKRIRQHNCEIKGGAKYTKSFGPNWSFVLVLTSASLAFDNHIALSLEWHMKPHGKKRSSLADPVDRRIELLKKALVHPKFVNLPITIYVAPFYIHRFQIALMPFINVAIVENLSDVEKAKVKAEKVVKAKIVKVKEAAVETIKNSSCLEQV